MSASASISASIVLRDLRWPDLPTCARAEEVLFPHDAWTEPVFWAELAARPRRTYVVAERAGEVLGYAGLDLGGEVADIMTVAVLPQVQGAGLGAVLLAELERRAAASGAAYLMLEVREDNEPAKNLYERAGFSTVRVRRKYYQPGDVDALVLRKEIAA